MILHGYTGSKEDFLALLDQLAAAGRRVIAIDMRGQYQTAGTPDGYSASALGDDIAAIALATEARAPSLARPRSLRGPLDVGASDGAWSYWPARKCSRERARSSTGWSGSGSGRG